MPDGPLSGVKVIEFTTNVAGPHALRQLAYWGATVIKVESTAHLDIQRGSMMPMVDNIPGLNRGICFLLHNGGKMSLGLNVKDPRGMDIAHRLVEWADVVYQNFGVGVMRRMGLGYEVLKEINPGIIMVSSSITGDRCSSVPAYQMARGGAATVQGLTGFNDLALWPGEHWTRSGLDIPPGDLMAPVIGATAVIAALAYRRRTGKGQHIDLAQTEAIIHELAVPFLDYQVNGRESQRPLNRHRTAAPHGAFRCHGDEQWCTIAVFDDAQWQGLCHAMGDPDWCAEPRFATPEARKGNEDALDAIIEAWTSQRTAHEVMEALQGRGVPAGVVQTLEDLMDHDPQAAHVDLFPMRRHAVAGEVRHMALPYHLSDSAGELKTGPLFGEHTAYVCQEILGMSDGEFEELKAAGVLEDVSLDDMEAWWAAPAIRPQG